MNNILTFNELKEIAKKIAIDDDRVEKLYIEQLETQSMFIDVYRRKVNARHHFIPFATYVTMFPQLVAGPIVRYADIDVQLDHRKEKSFALWGGCRGIFDGVGKKSTFSQYHRSYLG